MSIGQTRPGPFRLRRRAVAARVAHNHEVAGSSPAAAIGTNPGGSDHTRNRAKVRLAGFDSPS